MEKIQIGTVLKPQGIMGQIKISDFTDGKNAIKYLDEVFIDNTSYKVLQKSTGPQCIFLTLKGVADRNTAELLRGKDVFCDKDKINVSSDRFFITDIIGCSLYLSSGKLLGEIVDVQVASTDIFTVKTQEGMCYFPFLKKLNAQMDLENKKITVDAKIFTEVCLYQ